ncbi:Potassium-transporting ATPase C chain [compost metagenome]
MLSQLRPALSLLALMTLLTGVAYPLTVTGIAQVAFPAQANGSQVHDAKGDVRGSALLAQNFDGSEWFQPRPSAAPGGAEHRAALIGPAVVNVLALNTQLNEMTR